MHRANLGLTPPPQHPLGFPKHHLEPGHGWVWPQNQRKEKQHTQILIPLSVYCLEGYSLQCVGGHYHAGIVKARAVLCPAYALVL